MAQDKAIKEGSNGLLCASCQYALIGLDPDSVCPECGFSIAWSSELAAEQLRPGDEVPRIRLAMFLLLLSTIIGMPGIAVYALLTCTLWLAGTTALPGWLFWGFQGLLLLGSVLPLLTLTSLPRRVQENRGILLTASWVIVCLLGLGLINSGNESTFMLGSALAVISVILNLTRANRSIGSVIPAWSRLGQARQTRGPLITAVIVIAVGRIVLNTFGMTLNYAPPQYGPLIWVYLLMVATEALLLIGSIYLFFNRLWISLRLWRSMMSTPKRP